eukprot:2968286-Amphidinium_carterae.1
MVFPTMSERSELRHLRATLPLSDPLVWLPLAALWGPPQPAISHPFVTAKLVGYIRVVVDADRLRSWLAQASKAVRESLFGLLRAEIGCVPHGLAKAQTAWLMQFERLACAQLFGRAFAMPAWAVGDVMQQNKAAEAVNRVRDKLAAGEELLTCPSGKLRRVYDAHLARRGIVPVRSAAEMKKRAAQAILKWIRS